MFEKFTERGRKIMSLARQEAQICNSECIGTEHILLGILVEGCGVAARILKKLGVTTQDVHSQVKQVVPPSTSPVVHLGQVPFSPRVKRVLEMAEEEAVTQNTGTIGTGEILVGLMRETEGVAAQILKNLKVNFDQVYHEVREIQKGEFPDNDLKDALSVSKPSDNGVKMTVRILREKQATSKATDITIVMNGRYYEEVGCVQVSGVRSDKAFSTAKAIAEEAESDCYIVEFH